MEAGCFRGVLPAAGEENTVNQRFLRFIIAYSPQIYKCKTTKSKWTGGEIFYR